MYRMQFQLLLWSLILSVMSISGIRAQDNNQDPMAIFLTWNEDPTTTMSIDWHNTRRTYQQLYYRERGSSQWQEVPGRLYAFPHSDRVVHRAVLQELKPGAAYEVKFREEAESYYFRTIPTR